MKPWSSTKSCQMALAFRPLASDCSMNSRNGSHWLAVGRCGAGGAAESGDTSLAAFAGTPESGDTSLAGFAGGRRPQPPAGLTAIPAALRYAPAVSRGFRSLSQCAVTASQAGPARSPAVVCRRSRHCSRRGRVTLPSGSMSCPSPLAGFEVSLIGRFWVSPEARCAPWSSASMPSECRPASPGLPIGGQVLPPHPFHTSPGATALRNRVCPAVRSDGSLAECVSRPATATFAAVFRRREISAP